MKQYRNLPKLDDFEAYTPLASALARARAKTYETVETLSRGQGQRVSHRHGHLLNPQQRHLDSVWTTFCLIEFRAQTTPLPAREIGPCDP